MTWIRTVPSTRTTSCGRPERPSRRSTRSSMPSRCTRATGHRGIVASHTLIPEALYHAFATFGALMSPDLPLTRRQHEMITTVVSVTNRCRY